MKKYKRWCYEEEVRVRRPLTGEGLCYADFGEDLCLPMVIAGISCSISREEIARAIGNPEIKILKAALAHDRFRIVECEGGFQQTESDE